MAVISERKPPEADQSATMILKDSSPPFCVCNWSMMGLTVSSAVTGSR